MSQRRERITELRLQATPTCMEKMENLVKFRRAILEISVRTDRQTDRQTDTLITILRPHTRGVVNTYDLRYRKTLRLSHARYALNDVTHTSDKM